MLHFLKKVTLMRARRLLRNCLEKKRNSLRGFGDERKDIKRNKKDLGSEEVLAAGYLAP
jgi:hypothetical protein